MSRPAVEAQPWIAPSIDPANAGDIGDEALSAEELDQVLEQARREGFAQGREEGLRSGEQELRRRVARLDQLHRALSRPLDQIDEEVQQRIVALSISLAQQVLRVELSSRPELLLPLVREAVAELAPNSDPPRISLHPEDLSLLSELLRESEEGKDWQLLSDTRVSAGGCRVHSGYMEIDAQLETRLSAVVGKLQTQFETLRQP